MSKFAHPKSHHSQKIKIMSWVLIISILLMLVKVYAYYQTQSVAILTDAAESLINIIAAGLALYSIYLAARPKDHDHPYGHGKVEFLSAGLEGILMFLAGIALMVKTGFHFFHEPHIEQLPLGIVIISMAGLVNLFMGLYLINHGKRWNSISLEADGQHLKTDAITSIGLLIGLLAIHFFNLPWIDPVMAVALGAMLIFNGYKILRKAISGVMDEADESLIEEVIEVLRMNRKDEWIDFHNMRIIKYGSDLHVDAHITLPFYWKLEKVHEEMDAVDDLLNRNSEIANIEVFIHPDPCLPVLCEHCLVKDCVERKSNFREEVKWTKEGMMKNRKLGLE